MFNIIQQKHIGDGIKMTVTFIDKNKENKLKELLVFLNENNVYYNNLFKEKKLKLNEKDWKIESFYQLPILTKKSINDNYDNYISLNQEGFLYEITSGSTGTPLKCIKTASERVIASIALWKERKQWDKNVNVRNFIPLVGIETYTNIGDFCNFEVANMKACFDNLQKKSPRWISGPISVIEKYAQLIDRGILKYTNKSIKFIELAGEYADPSIRNYVERIFDCETTNQYGLRESWCIGYECKHGNIHVLENILMELGSSIEVDDKKLNELIVTSLYNKAMPFIRYNTHDIGELDIMACNCGKTSQIIKLYGGRTGDIIRGKKEVLGDIFFKRVVNDVIESGFNSIESFRVEQLLEDKFEIFIVRNATYTEQVSIMLKNLIQSNLGRHIDIDIHYVDKIPPLSSGKMKTFYSHLN